jgi:uncharacterized protein with PIN domain
MNSNGLITINKTLCNYCLESFYELKDYELSECPHCHESLEDMSSFEVEETIEAQIVVDFVTGALKEQ